MESELFGHAKGSFTGAIAPKRGKVESAIRLSGTKVQPRPNPCSTPETMTGIGPICSEKALICHIESAVSRNPNRMMSRASTRLISRPTRNIATIVPRPRGAMTSPVVSAG